MVKVYVGIGSNIDREKNIPGGLKALAERFGKLFISPVYQCKSFGFDGDDFFNLVAAFITFKEINDVIAEIKDIEYAFGRTRKETRYSSRTLDIDLLLYGDVVSEQFDVPRKDIEKYIFVLKPLYDLNPYLVHPVTGKTIADLWQGFDKTDHMLTEVNVELGND